MRLTILTTIFAFNLFFSDSQVIFVDNFNAVYPHYETTQTITSFDINSDGTDDINLLQTFQATVGTCNSVTGSKHWALFEGLTTAYGTCRVNAPSDNTLLGYDCDGDVLDLMDDWNQYSRLFYAITFPDALCQNIGYGNHKQGFRIMAEMPTGGNGYLYGYFDYTLTNTGDIIIHGWYYESQFNTPIDVGGSGTASLEELSTEKDLKKVVDLLGRETTPEPNKVLIYIYSDGTSERVFKVE